MAIIATLRACEYTILVIHATLYKPATIKTDIVPISCSLDTIDCPGIKKKPSRGGY